MGLTITQSDGTVKSSGTGTAGANKEVQKESGTFVLGRPLHLTADDKVVEEDDPAGVKVLGGKGSTVSAEDVKKYGLDDSHKSASPTEVAPEVAPASKTEKPKVEPKSKAESKLEKPEDANH